MFAWRDDAAGKRKARPAIIFRIWNMGVNERKNIKSTL